MQNHSLPGVNHFLMIAVVIVSISMLDVLIPGARYVKYVLPLYFIAIIAIESRSGAFSVKNIHPVIAAFAAYAIWGVLVSLLMHGEISAEGVNDFVFVISYAIPLAFFFSPSLSMENVFKIFTAFFLLSCFGLPYKSFSIIDSTAPFESGASFVFGAFALFFLMSERKWYMVLAICLMVISLKRIALIGFLLCTAVYFCPLQIKKFVLSKFSFLALNFFCAVVILAVGFGVFDELVLEMTGMNIHSFTMGRFTHYLGVVDEIENNPWSLLSGNGIGSAYYYAGFYMDDDLFVNLHSDTLKILFEAGVLVFVAFFVLLGRAKSLDSRNIILYLMILFFTDNVLIYVGTMFFILLIFLHLEHSPEKGGDKCLTSN